MTLSLISIKTDQLPEAADAGRADAGLIRLRESLAADPELAGFYEAVAGDGAGRALLDAVFGNSPYLGRCLIQEAGCARDVLTGGPDAAFAALLSELGQALARETGLNRVTVALRRAKRRAALVVGLADIAGLWPLERVTGALTDLAELCLHIATRYVLGSAAAQGAIELSDESDPERGSGYIVLGMGKLGARELNYSSDIDLIVLYDAERVRGAAEDALGPIFVKATRQLLHLMDARTEDGYVFRTDLRLRPDPGATPVAVSAEAAEAYYESVGQNWERAAMIKARPVAGDIAAGESFLNRLRPYIWRKNLDFAAIQDVHSIKRQINAHRGGARIAVNGHNIKLGRGGIREIEFFCQTQQLIWGGRIPELRSRATVETLRILARTGRIDTTTADEMSDGYAFLRKLEHRLQMINDEQTHDLPRDDGGVARVAAFMGYANAAAFREALLHHLGRVEHHYARLFEESPELGAGGALVFTGGENHPDTVKTLEEMGFADGGSISNIVRNWHHGRYRATRSERARQILTELMPHLLKAFANAVNPDTAFARFDEFIGGLPAGVQLFSLFNANPALLDMVADIMGGAPRIADWLSRNPSLLDAVLTGDFMNPLGPGEELAEELETLLQQANDYEDVLVLTRRWANDQKFRVGVQILRGVVGGAAAGAALTAVADTVLCALLPRVEAEFARRHGRVAGGGLAIVALGKLGSAELSPGSDLDLVFVYDHDEKAEASDGKKPLAPGTWFGRLCQRLISAITAPMAEGSLYEIDMRLRPSGNAGPTASRLDGFERYHREEAWTWEHMALTRARVVAATSSDIDDRITTVICQTLARSRDPDRLLVDVADMRLRMAAQHKGESRWDVKHHRGGLVDIEFIAQYLQLLHGPTHPRVFAENTVEALERLGEAGVIGIDKVATLVQALELWWRLQDALRLMAAGAFAEETAPASLKAALARAASQPDFDSLCRTMDAAHETVRAVYHDIVDVPAERARKRLPPPEET
ncbi:MAG: bifunctional [glutamine synthetase] adenylyltransferase/[glutamine synthetase]-adenylyl-L-tyrosine phosphorylase [Alphaproteobacteria bacterium]|nr:bifunctional [glutamine synthetase] adenylyltransferase/[glutamine synthetase]-adenylyl-L-tyrosine phosphorylase [Alphaproteobacteria bacterium]